MAMHHEIVVKAFVTAFVFVVKAFVFVVKAFVTVSQAEC